MDYKCCASEKFGAMGPRRLGVEVGWTMVVLINHLGSMFNDFCV